MTESKSFNKHPKNKALYHVVMESILADEDVMDQGAADKQKKRKPDDDDRNEGPSCWIRPRPKSTGKSVQLKEIVFEAVNTKMPLNQGDGTGNTDAQTDVKTWLNDLANAKNPPLSFNELMSTPIDFFAFAMNRLKISNLIKADLVGAVYNLPKGTRKSCVKQENKIEECYRALYDQLDWNYPEGNRCPYELNKPLPLQEI
nr:hypothetical protein [Tanacetum cinerariifolium]